MTAERNPDFALRLLGSPVFRLPDRTLSFSLPDPDKPSFLLFLLATTEKPSTRDEICDILWSGAPKDRARASLSTALYNLSGRIGPPDSPGKTRTNLFWNLPPPPSTSAGSSSRFRRRAARRSILP